MKKFFLNINTGQSTAETVRDIFIIFWQSNAQGDGIVANLPVQDQAINEFCYMYSLTGNVLEHLNPGVNSKGRDIGKFGLEQQFAKRYRQEKKKPFIFLKYAVGSTFMPNTETPVDWTPNVSGELFDSLCDRITALDMKLRAGKIPFRWAGLIGMGGEQDATREDTANAHEAETLAFVAAIRSLPEINDPTLPYVFGRPNGALDPSMIYRDTVRAGDANIAAASIYNHMIDTDSYSLSDVVHYDTEGQLQFGNDVYNVFNDNGYI